MTVYRQEVIKIYRDVERCPECGGPMKRSYRAFPTSPVQYEWHCIPCDKTITSFVSGEPYYLYGDMFPIEEGKKE